MKKFRAFTLIELIVAMAIFGIIMSAVVRMVSPISENAAATKVGSKQQTVEASMATYLSSTLKYATNIAVIQGDSTLSPKDAIADFKTAAVDASKGFGAVDTKGTPITTWNTDMEDKLQMIIFDGCNTYNYNNFGYKGRLVSMVSGKGSTVASLNSFGGQSDCKKDGSGNFYEVFGNDFYAQGDYFVNAELTDVGINFVFDSDYFFNSGSKKAAGTPDSNGLYQNTSKLSSTSHNPTDVWVDLRNRKPDGIDVFEPTKFTVKFLTHRAGNPPDVVTRVRSNRTTPNMIYIIYMVPNPESAEEYGWWVD